MAKNPYLPKRRPPTNFKQTQKSKGILDDYANRQVITTKEGSIQDTPTDPKHIVNKEYVDNADDALREEILWEKDGDDHAQLKDNTLSIKMRNNQINTLADGVDATDAVNKGQMDTGDLWELDGTTLQPKSNPGTFSMVATSGNAEFSGATTTIIGANSNKLNLLAGDNIQVLTANGINMFNKKITNLADGTADTDAVNKGQMDTADALLVPYTGANADVDLGNYDLTATQINADETLSVNSTPNSSAILTGTKTSTNVRGIDLTTTSSFQSGADKNSYVIKLDHTQSGGGMTDTLMRADFTGGGGSTGKGLDISYTSIGGSTFKPWIFSSSIGSGTNLIDFDNTITMSGTGSGATGVKHTYTNSGGFGTSYGTWVKTTDTASSGKPTFYGNYAEVAASNSYNPIYGLGAYTGYYAKMYNNGASIGTDQKGFWASYKPNMVTDAMYGAYVDNAGSTLNNPTALQVGYYVNNDQAGTDTNNKRWAFYNAGTNATASKVLLGLDNVKTYWGTGNDLAIYSDGTDGVIEGDIYFNGSGGGLPFGEIYVNGNTTATTISTQNTWYQFTGFDTNGQSNLTTPDHTNDHITISKDGVYKIDAQIAFSGGGGKTYEIEVFKNNGATGLTNLHTERKLGTAGDVGSCSITGMCSCSANDTIELWVRCTDLATADATLRDVNLNLMQIGG